MSAHMPDLPFSADYYKGAAERWQRNYDDMRAQRDGLLEAAKYMQRELWNLSLTPIRESVAIDDEHTLEALDAVEKAYVVLSETLNKVEGKE